MKTFRVKIEGSGFLAPAGNDFRRIGFIATRDVREKDQDAAAQLAKRVVEKELAVMKIRPTGESRIGIQSLKKRPLFAGLLGAPKGFAFKEEE